jgi:hypothetical protein
MTVGLSNILAALQNGVVATNRVRQQVAATFPRAGAVSSSAPVPGMAPRSNDAGYRLLFEQLAHGDCVILKPGTMVILEREEMNSVPQIVCLRPLGDDGCYWASWSLAPDQGLSR